jgi:glycosyltransferase involved in cell wall biosynthesis
VSASDKLFAAIPNVCVHFIGVVSTPFGGDRIVESLKNSSRGHYIIHGHRDNALEFVHAADIAVLTSKSEAFPRAIAEYLAIGKPIISTRVAGADEMIKHKKNGLLIEIDDADGLVDSIKLLANDLDLRKSFGREACASYCALYSAKQQLKSFNDIFDEIVSASQWK